MTISDPQDVQMAHPQLGQESQSVSSGCNLVLQFKHFFSNMRTYTIVSLSSHITVETFYHNLIISRIVVLSEPTIEMISCLILSTQFHSLFLSIIVWMA